MLKWRKSRESAQAAAQFLKKASLNALRAAKALLMMMRYFKYLGVSQMKMSFDDDDGFDDDDNDGFGDDD